jgi:hypothetical protein
MRPLEQAQGDNARGASRRAPMSVRSPASSPGSTWKLAALAFALETGLVDAIGEPARAAAVAHRVDMPPPLVEAVLDVICTTGLVRREGQAFVAEPGFVRCLEGPSRDLLQAEIRSHQLQALHLVESGRRRGVRLGWVPCGSRDPSGPGHTVARSRQGVCQPRLPTAPGTFEGVARTSPDLP